jgi:two-component system, NtrC family, response regulator AlgB
VPCAIIGEKSKLRRAVPFSWTKLATLLQEREYERLGENVTRPANLRVIAATNRDLKKRMAEGLFREDLYFRLNVITVEMPPLRARPGDLLHFAEHYLKYFSAQCGRRLEGFSKEAIDCLRAYTWPGNLRELRNSIERAVIMARGGVLIPKDLPTDVSCPAVAGEPGKGSSTNGDSLLTLAQMEERHLREVLKRTSSLAEASCVLGIDQATLYRKRLKIGLD